MATKVVKDDVIRVRVTLKQKKKLKEIAKEKNETMSEILSVATEEKIQEIKLKLEQRKVENKKMTKKFLVFDRN